MKFVIRDDDICYHTDPDVLKYLYNDISKDCPISFACIPFVGGYDVDSYSPEKWKEFDLQWVEWQTKDIFPIGKNDNLVLLLNKWHKSNRATFMLHGIHHDLYEFTQNKEFTNDIRKAKVYLDQLFSCNITVTSLPNNSLGPWATRGLVNNGFNILTAFGHLPNERPFSFKNYINFIRLLYLYFRFGKRIRLTYPLDFGSHFEQPCYEIGPSTCYDDLVSGLKLAVKNNGNFVVATHYYHLFANPELHSMLKEIVELAKDLTHDKVEFVSADRLFDN
jgi:hypothetical protein